MIEIITRSIVQVGNRFMIPVPVNSCKAMGMTKGSKISVVIDVENFNIVATPLVIAHHFEVPYKIVGYEKHFKQEGSNGSKSKGTNAYG